jgi:hypothetical protein
MDYHANCKDRRGDMIDYAHVIGDSEILLRNQDTPAGLTSQKRDENRASQVKI